MAQRQDFRDVISRNKWKSFFLMISVFLVLVGFIYVIGRALSPANSLVILVLGIIISLLYVWGSFYNSHKLAVKSVNAKLASREKYPVYHSLVEGLTIASGLPKPKLYVMPSEQINAFASGRNPQNAVVCVTEGALDKLERRELEGVLAHELGHIKNYDIRYMTLVTVMVGMIAIISEIFLYSFLFGAGDSGGGDDAGLKWVFILAGLVLAILAPIVVSLIQASISRKREYSADASAVKFTRYPEGLIGALEKIKGDKPVSTKKVSKAVAPLFISAPLKNLQSTHPPLDKRIELLRRM
ncbi:MAG: M48 family metallopeptidase [Candidatus Pacearchaeota archaeon]